MTHPMTKDRIERMDIDFSGNRPCPNCDDTGWVCEGHPNRPSSIVSKRKDACDCGPGEPCPACVLEGQYPDDARWMATQH